jgi:hypothetical protein
MLPLSRLLLRKYAYNEQENVLALTTIGGELVRNKKSS